MSVIAATRPKGEEAEECRSRGSHELREDAEKEEAIFRLARSLMTPLRVARPTTAGETVRLLRWEWEGGGKSANKAARSRSMASVFKPGKDVGGVLLGPDDRVEDLDDASPLGDQRQAFVERPAGGGERRQPERSRQLPLRV
jgi:hypothetical protein